MFLHEPGEDSDSFSRQDLSSMNAAVSQRPSFGTSSSSSSKPAQTTTHPIPPPQQAPQMVAAVSRPSSRHASADESANQSSSNDGSALPSSASWATKNTHLDRRPSKPTPIAQLSPPPPQSILPAQTTEPPPPPSPSPTRSPSPASSQYGNIPQALFQKLSLGDDYPLNQAIRNVMNMPKFSFSLSQYSEQDQIAMEVYPCFIDWQGGLKRYRREKEREAEREKQQEDERNAMAAMSAPEDEEAPASGSLQLGGEPETRDGPNDVGSQLGSEPRSAIQPPFTSSALSGTSTFSSSPFGTTPSNLSILGGRSLTPQQQQHLSMFRSNVDHQPPFNAQTQQGYSGMSQHHHQQSNPFQSQGPSFGSAPGHARHASRFTFANDTLSATTSVKPTANPQLMAQQSAMMPSNQTKQYQGHSIQQSNLSGNQFYSGVQGPPPGLKSSGTPPISGGGMFAQGYGFTNSTVGFGGNYGGGKAGSDELSRDLLRGRSGVVGGQGADVGKREFKFPSSMHQPTSSNSAFGSGLQSSFPETQLGAYNGFQDPSLYRQKKKGKKHRHANTSSSGGGGIDDLADPSILQARMHHGASHGQYGVQNQGGYNQASMAYNSAYGGRW